MKTIIGRQDRPTPVLSSAIHSLVVNPSWTIPRSIALRDILPRWAADADYLKRHNYKVVSGWQRPRRLVPEERVRGAPFYRGGEYLSLWQPPGKNNALGQLKFDFANPHAVYLHDTPHRGLFQQRQRAFSSGCVRLEDSFRLARYLLRWNQSPVPLEQLIDQQGTQRVHLKRPVPVHLTYWTAWLDDGGTLHFRPDIYHQDRADFAVHQLDQLLVQLYDG